MAITLDQLTAGGATVDQWKKYLDQAKATPGAGYVSTDINSTYRIPGPNDVYAAYKVLAPGVSVTGGGTTSVLGAQGTPNQISIYQPEASTYLSYEDVYNAIYGTPSGATNTATLYPNVSGSTGAGLTSSDIYAQYGVAGTGSPLDTTQAGSQPRTTLDAYGYPTTSTTPTGLPSIAGSTTSAPTAPPVTPIPSTPNLDNLSATVSTPDLPTQEAPTVSLSNIAGLQQSVDTARTSLETAYQTQLTSLQAQKDAAQKTIDDLTGKQADILQTQVPDYLQKLADARTQLEASERQRLSIETNFFENQKLVDELQGLLTDGNNLIEQMKGVTGLASIRNPRIQQTADAINARAGVIQAVMASRNSQISVAEGLIDRSANILNQNAQDQLNYWNSLLSFYGSQKNDAQTNLANLTTQERKYIDAQIGLLQNDLDRQNATQDYMKQLMINPQTALTVAKAGVTLQDSVEQINAKLAAYGQKQEIIDLQNKMASSGYNYLSPGQNPPPGSKTVAVLGSDGKQYTYYTDSNNPTTVQDVNGQKVLFDAKTGQQIAVLGKSDSATSGATAGLDPTTLNNLIASVKSNPSLFATLPADQRTAVLSALTSQGYDVSKLTEQSAKAAGMTAAEVTSLANQVKGNPALFPTLTADQRAAVLGEYAKNGWDTTTLTNAANAPTPTQQQNQLEDALKGLQSISRNLEPGMTGTDVLALQTYLKAQGYNITPSGTYDQSTVQAVTQLQQKLGIDTAGYPGYYGPKTKAALGIQSTTKTTSILTKDQLTKFQAIGVDSALATNIASAILSGQTLDSIRQDLRSLGIDPVVLDQFDNIVGIQALLKTGSSPTGGGFQ